MEEEPPERKSFSCFLYELAEELGVEESKKLAYLGGVSGGGCAGQCCCCSGRGGSLDVLERLQSARKFNEDDLSPLVELLEIMGRNDLAKKCEAAEFKKSTHIVAVQETEDHLQSVSIDFQPIRNGDEHCRFVESCPLPVSYPTDDTLPHDPLVSSAVVISSSSTMTDDFCTLPHSTRGCPTVSMPTATPLPMHGQAGACVDIPLHVCKRKRFPCKRRDKGCTTPLPFTGSSDSFHEYEVIEAPPSSAESPPSSAEVPPSSAEVPPSSAEVPPSSAEIPSSVSSQHSPFKLDTRSSIRSSSSHSPVSSPSPDLSISSPSHSPTIPEDDFVQVESPQAADFQIPRGQSLDVPSSSSFTNCKLRTRSFTAPILNKLNSFRRQMRVSQSDSNTKMTSSSTQSCNPSFLWQIKTSDLLSRISKGPSKPMEKKFLAKTLADNNKFRLQFVLQLYPSGLDFDQGQYCTLKIDAHCKDNQHLLRQQLQLQVVGVAGDIFLKEVKKPCTVGESFIVREFLSHEVLHSQAKDTKYVELQLSLLLQYTLNGEDAWVHIGKDQVL